MHSNSLIDANITVSIICVNNRVAIREGFNKGGANQIARFSIRHTSLHAILSSDATLCKINMITRLFFFFTCEFTKRGNTCA